MSLKTTTRSPARLWVLLARRNPVGVVLRRGPSKQVRLIKWDTRSDAFEFGQWFKGRIYERNCDLSPSGELLIYSAAKYGGPLAGWTAVSRPPYFTALALWPRSYHSDGGGWFVDETRICLNQDPAEAALHPNFRLGPLQVVGCSDAADVWDFVRRRDGWQQTSKGRPLDRGLARGWEYNPPERWRKPDPSTGKLTLEMDILAIGGSRPAWYDIKYRVVAEGHVALDLGGADWADWEHRGDLVFAKDGCLFRHRFRELTPDYAVQIADFNAQKFEEVLPTFEAQRW